MRSDYEYYAQVKEVIDPFNDEFLVDATLSQTEEFQAAFFIEVAPSVPRQWQLLYAGVPHDGIMLGEAEEFDSKVRGMFQLLMDSVAIVPQLPHF